MEIRIVVFLFFVSVTVITNTLAIFFAYRAFAGVTSKIGETMSDISKSSDTREVIDSLRVAAEQAAAVTESAKRRIAEFDPILARTQETYKRSLSIIDSKLENAADNINTSAEKMRDIVAKPAFSVASFAAGMARVLHEPNDG
jgi:phosphoenolpyruvate carboxylase